MKQKDRKGLSHPVIEDMVVTSPCFLVVQVTTELFESLYISRMKSGCFCVQRLLM